MKLSRYVLRYDTEDGSVYFNTNQIARIIINNCMKLFQMWTREGEAKMSIKKNKKVVKKPEVVSNNCNIC